MKKLVSILLIMVMCIGIIPNTASAAVKINKKNITLNVGKTATLKITGTKGKVAWTSSKKSIATVSGNGKVTAKKEGQATITAKVDSKKYTCKVKVEEEEVTVTSYNEFTFDGFSDYLSKLDIKVIENDYSTTYKMKKSAQKELLSYIYNHYAENEIDKPSYYHSIDINSNMTDFEATVNKDEYLKNKKAIQLFLGFLQLVQDISSFLNQVLVINLISKS